MSDGRGNLGDRARALKPAGATSILGGVLPMAAAIGIAMLFHFLLPRILPNDYYARVILDIGINVILAVSLTMVNGFTGQFSMGHAAFMAVGAYVGAGLVYYGSFRLFGDASMHGGVLSGLGLSRERTLTNFDGWVLWTTVGLICTAVSAWTAAQLWRRLRSASSTLSQFAWAVGLVVAGLVLVVSFVSLVRLQGVSLPGVWQEMRSSGLWGSLRAVLAAWGHVIPPADRLFLLAVVTGGGVAAACGYLVGLPSLRLRGDYLAIVTLGFGEIVRVLIQTQTTDSLYDAAEVAATPWWKLPAYLGGPVGFTGLPFYTSLFWVWLFAVITLIVAYRLKESTFGRAFLSIREDEIAAEAMGVKTTKYKVRAFVIAAFFAGIAGGLYAHTTGIQLNAGELGFLKSFDIIIMVVLGGMGSISGAAIAAAILSVLPEALRRPPPITDPILAGIIVVSAVLILLFTQRKVRSLVLLALAVAAYESVRRIAKANGINLADYRMILYALALVMMMIMRPQGLFGVRELWNAWHLRRAKKGGAP